MMTLIGVFSQVNKTLWAGLPFKNHIYPIQFNQSTVICLYPLFVSSYNLILEKLSY